MCFNTICFAWLFWGTSVGFSSLAHGQTGDGTVQWMVMQTPHFNVYYPRGIYNFALRVGNLSEEAHKTLVPYVGHSPARRTHVIILNNTDSANGAATALPRNTVFLFTAPPDSRGVLNDSDDWLRGLIYHEYLHVLHLDTMSQVFRMVNVILGKMYAPNMLMPRWWVEGWATYVETAFTGGGRGRSSLFDAYMRSAILSGKPLRLSQVSNVTVRWPRGTSAYLYGNRFLTYIAKKYGPKKLAEIAYYYGEALFPYGMNLVAKRVLKKPYRKLWAEWLQFLKKKYEKEAHRIRRHSLTKVRVLTKSGGWFGVPRYLPNGQEILVFRVDGSGPERLDLIHRVTKQKRLVLQTNSFSLFGFDRTGTKGVLSQAKISRGIYSYYDLFTFSPHKGQPKRLTYRERAKEPDVSPDGKEVVYVRHRAGKTSLWVRDLKHNRPKLLFQPASRVFLSSPRYSPDGLWIVCSGWFPGGARDLLLLHRKTRKVRRLTHDRAQDLEPIFTPDGKEVVFASDLSGVYNLYALRLSDLRRRRLTNELYGAFAPAVSPNGKFLAFAQFGPNGLNLVEMDFAPKKQPFPMPTIRKKWPEKVYQTPRQIYPVRRYRASSTLLPQNWSPVFGADYAGQTVGLRFSGSDILGFHSYQISAGYGLSSQEISYGIAYHYRQFYPSFSLSHGRYPRTAFGALSINGKDVPFSERVTSGSFGIEVPFVNLLSSHILSVNYELNYLEPITLQVPLRPADIPPKFPEMGLLTRLSLGWFFSSARRFGRSISSEQGRQVWLQLNVQHPYLGSIGESWSLQGGWAEFLRMPWVKHHVLAFNLVGGIGRSSFRVRQLFYLGGIPAQNLFQVVSRGANVNGGHLRGYPAFRFSGDASLLLQTEYRFPIVDIERGLGIGPVFLRRMHFAFFSDVGQVFRETYAWEQLAGVKVGLGMELRIEALIGYYLRINIRFGFAKGLMQDGIDHLYLVMGSSF